MARNWRGTEGECIPGLLNYGILSYVSGYLDLRNLRYNSVKRSLCGWKYSVHLCRSVYPTQLIMTPNLHPLLISKLRDECTGIPGLNAGPLPKRPDSLDGSFYGDWTLEVRRIGLNPAHEFHQPLGLFGSHCGYTSVNCPDISISETEVYTVAKVAHFHHSRAHAEDEHTVFLVLCAELGHNDVQSRLGGRV